MRLKPGIQAIAAVAVATSMALVGCSSDTGSTESSSANTDRLVIAEPQAPDTLDPIASSLYQVDSMVWATVYDTLATTSVTGEVTGLLAEDWTISPDGLTYTFTLREGAKFHNGNPVTAQDVIYSLERARTEGIPMVTARLENIEKLKAPDDRTVVITLKQADSSFIYTLADPSGVGVAILDHRATEDPATHPIGSGPFKFVSYSPNSHLVLERNDDYWNPDVLPPYRTLEIRFIADDQSQVAALNAGDVSLIMPTEAATVQSLRANSAVKLTSYSNLNFFITISRVGKTAPPEVAKAVALAIDRDALVKTAFLGEAEPGSTVHPALDYAVPISQLPNYTRDVEKAKELLRQAGYPDGIDLNLIYPTRPPYRDSIFEVLQASLADAGIRVTLQPVEQQVWLSHFLEADYDLSASDQGWYANPIRYVLPRDGWQAPPSEVAPELPDLLAAYQSAATDQARAEAFQAIQRYEAEHAYPFIGTAWVKRSVAYRANEVAEVDATSLVTGSRRDFYLSLSPSGA